MDCDAIPNRKGVRDNQKVGTTATLAGYWVFEPWEGNGWMYYYRQIDAIRSTSIINSPSHVTNE